jgi:phenylacetate-CoA ligase
LKCLHTGTPADEMPERGFENFRPATRHREHVPMSFEDSIHRWLGRYMSLPPWARTPVGTLYRQLPRAWRHGSRYPSFAVDAALGTGGVPAQRVDARLRETLARAVVEVPAYRDTGHALRPSRSGFEWLREFPLTRKEHIKQNFNAYVSCARPASRRLQTFTGGSTAQPMAFYLERGVTRPRETAYFEAIERTIGGARPGEWTLSLRGRTVDSAARSSGRMWAIEPIKRHVILSSDHLERRYMPANVEALRHWRPTAIHAFPSALYPLALWLDEHPQPDMTRAIRTILLTSENVYPFQESLFERVFGCAVVRHYGHSERAAMANSLPGDTRYHFWPLYGFVELVDDEGRTIDTPGRLGEIVATGFDNAVQPFIRYCTGDLGEWDLAPNLEGHVRLIMRRIEGRRQEFVVCRDARVVSITTLGAAHFSALASVEAIQFEQHLPGRITLNVVTARPLTESERTAIAAAVREKTQGGCDVDVVEVERIERTARGKHRMLMQHLDLSRYLGAAVTPAHEDGLLAAA